MKPFYFLILEQYCLINIFPFPTLGSVLNTPRFSITKLLFFGMEKGNSHGPIIQKECCWFVLQHPLPLSKGKGN